MKCFLLVILSLIYVIQGEKCPNGGEIFERGITQEDEQLIVDFANKLHQKALRDTIWWPARFLMGSDIINKRVHYDKALEKNAQEAIRSCEIVIPESTTPTQYKGQSSDPNFELDWATVLQKWHDNATSKPMYNSYWFSAEGLGCDYIKYRDPSESEYPYAKLFYCNTA